MGDDSQMEQKSEGNMMASSMEEVELRTVREAGKNQNGNQNGKSKKCKGKKNCRRKGRSNKPKKKRCKNGKKCRKGRNNKPKKKKSKNGRKCRKGRNNKPEKKEK